MTGLRESPSVRDQRLCAPCRERSRHPILQSGTTLPTLVEGVLAMLRAIGLPALGIALVAELHVAGKPRRG